MIARRRAPRPPQASSPAAKRAAVLLEEIRGQNRLVLEAVVAHREQTDRQAADALRQFAAIRGELDGVHGAIGGIHGELGGIHGELDRIHGRLDVIHGELGSIRAGVGQHSRELRELSTRVEKKAEGAALAALERRVTAVERSPAE